eukprot:CAMPEP_0181225908 /NCGR_PEP_ID=MMETSP1096-20121128/31959_1 /TAXON_ID=156174 ORGANISM="Chrysochromulina ericina, Strain CCMP281" /NCGR_SAMPLE_ID=MMETSP1096 /ASSEMBLY_ACC=CAM_ASM_000453 /LENGTH=87 /DNA_ID=CAMNT_0023319185 /DNA_START=429 /DNA_END=692 /DNA_ORIENTATION=+
MQKKSSLVSVLLDLVAGGANMPDPPFSIGFAISRFVFSRSSLVSFWSTKKAPPAATSAAAFTAAISKLTIAAGYAHADGAAQAKDAI